MERKVRSIGMKQLAAALVFLCATSVFAQDQTPAAQSGTPQTSDTAAKKADKQDTKTDKTKDSQSSDKSDTGLTFPDTKGPIVDLGYTNWDLTGNFRKFRQYATPAQGFYISRIFYDGMTPDLRYVGMFDIQAPFQTDYRLGGAAMLNWGHTIVRGSNSSNQFYTPSDLNIDPSVRQISNLFFRQKLLEGTAFTLRAKEDQQDQVFEAPYDPLHQRTQTWDALLQGSLSKKDFVSVDFTDSHYFDRTGVLPDTHLTQWSASYARQFLPTLNVDAGYKGSLIQQDNMANSQVQEWHAGGSLDIGDSSTLSARWRTENLSLPNVQNAYVKARSDEGVRFVSGYKGWTGQIGFDEQDEERVRADHLFVDTPTYRTLDARISGKVAPWLRFTAQGMEQTLQGAATMETEDPLALYWRDKDNAQLKLDAFIDNLSGYAVYEVGDQSNNNRDTSVHNRVFTLGGEWDVRPDLDFYAESTQDNWGATSGDPQATALGLYFPNADDFVVGMNWNMNPQITVTISYDQFWTNNSNPLLLPDGNVTGRFWNTGFTYRFLNGDEVGIVFSPWHYEDNVDNLRNYDTSLIALTLRLKF